MNPKQKRQYWRNKKRNTAQKVRANNKHVGSACFIASNQGFVKAKRLPAHFKPIINKAKAFVFSQSLTWDDGGITRKMNPNCLNKMFEILVTILTTCDLKSGKIGHVSNEGIDTKSHDDLMIEHALRWGYAVSSSTWYRYIHLLKKAGVFCCKEARIHMSKDTVRSFAAYKWLSLTFLGQLGVKMDDIKSSIEKAYQKALDTGKSFVWRTVKTLKSQLTKPEVFKSDLFDIDFDSPPPLH